MSPEETTPLSDHVVDPLVTPLHHRLAEILCGEDIYIYNVASNTTKKKHEPWSTGADGNELAQSLPALLLLAP